MKMKLKMKVMNVFSPYETPGSVLVITISLISLHILTFAQTSGIIHTSFLLAWQFLKKKVLTKKVLEQKKTHFNKAMQGEMSYFFPYKGVQSCSCSFTVNILFAFVLIQI